MKTKSNNARQWRTIYYASSYGSWRTHEDPIRTIKDATSTDERLAESAMKPFILMSYETNVESGEWDGVGITSYMAYLSAKHKPDREDDDRTGIPTWTGQYPHPISEYGYDLSGKVISRNLRIVAYDQNRYRDPTHPLFEGSTPVDGPIEVEDVERIVS